jgi:hypothetical protein
MGRSSSIKVKRNSQKTGIKRVEAKLERKKQELLNVKALHKKIAREYIDLWVMTNRLKRQSA